MTDYDFEQLKKDFLNGVSSAADAVSDAAKDTSKTVGRYKDFFETGAEIAKLNNTTHGGNMSVSDGQKIWITRTGARLARITPTDVIECDMAVSDKDIDASMELVVHREIYTTLARKSGREGLDFGTKAVIHAHCLYTNYLSLNGQKIVPADSEGRLLIKEADIVTCENSIASAEVGAKLAALFSAGANIAVVAGHGPFAVGNSLEAALQLVSSLEYSSQLLTLLA